MQKFLKPISIGLGLFLYILSFLCVVNISLPLLVTQTYESKPNQVLIVHTNNYRLGDTETYPIGALEWGGNNFRIENISNETIDTFFLLSLENLTCYDYLNATVFTENGSLEIFLAKNTVDEVSIPIEVDSHDSFQLKISIPQERCEFFSTSPLFPVAIYEWQFLEK